MSRWLIDGLKTFLWVAPLTILLWIYAEREQLARQNDLSAPIRLDCSSDRVVALVSPDEPRVLIDMEGPRASLDDVRDKLSAGKARPLNLMVPDDYQPGREYEMPVVERLAKDDFFKSRAIAITRARPATVRIRIEKKETRNLPVEVNPEQLGVGKATFAPTNVAVEAPASVFGVNETLAVYADISKFKEPGHYKEKVPITLMRHRRGEPPRPPNVRPFGIEQVSLPREVEATVDIQRSQSEVLPSIPVLVQLPAGILSQDLYTIKAQPTLANVEVTGPPDTVLALQNQKIAGMAVVQLTPEDLKQPGEIVKKLSPRDYRMPADVVVKSQVKEVKVTIAERTK